MAFEVSNTPSPPPRVKTPQTPKYGTYGDSWEPYSPRKSARISSQQANRTPSPRSFRNTTTTSRNSSTSIFSTPATSPQKKRAPAMDSIRRASGVTSTAESTNTSDPFGSASSLKKPTANMAATRTTTGMLPTPAKTPRKLPDEKVEAGVRAIARNLFPAESSSEVIATSRKKTKKYTGLTLDSFKAEDIEEDIQIFTDSRDRLPVIDTSTGNPFYGETTEATSQPSTRRSTRKKKITIPGEGRVSVDEAVKRDDGIVYVFRGKTFWKRRDDGNPDDDLNADDEDQETQVFDERSGSPPRRTTRSSLNRRLFAVAEKVTASHDTDDEEAATDIEDHVMNSNGQLGGNYDTPNESEKAAPDTPSAPRFAPASPPTTGRATRVSKEPAAADTPIRPRGKRSPFDAWRRCKSGPAKPQGQKRGGEALSSEAQSKRQRA
ncbi:hypothetical protein BJ170DRAFT_275640 [Xylariales sp. AK1849]|nr:hypothetical protein BJ170DRAFT_275640 [Xylariales sp. AK1849]